MGKVNIRSELCKGCGLCVTACPKGLLVISETEINQKGHPPAEMIDEEKCISCAFCAMMCPDCVIEVHK